MNGAVAVTQGTPGTVALHRLDLREDGKGYFFRRFCADIQPDGIVEARKIIVRRNNTIL